ncbi:MAG: hypothetical protein PHP53_15830 [Prolixibacteraceae bacterium]|nr:hypothetical protein [Prolixibacteraceae bacterium]
MNNNNRMGYSQKINDPAFAKYVKNANSYSGYFSLGLAFVAVLGFFINGEVSDNMENPESLFIGLGIGSMFILIAIFQIVGRNRGTTWDGVVVDKKTENKRRRSKYDESWINYTRYTVYIRADNGKTHTTSAEDDDTKYNYYRVGDRVRHHKGLNTYEKEDKSGDKIVFCNACASLNDIKEVFCFRCNCPLLK